jgi:hypothetical protein
MISAAPAIGDQMHISARVILMRVTADRIAIIIDGGLMCVALDGVAIADVLLTLALGDDHG